MYNILAIELTMLCLFNEYCFCDVLFFYDLTWDALYFFTNNLFLNMCLFFTAPMFCSTVALMLTFIADFVSNMNHPPMCKKRISSVLELMWILEYCFKKRNLLNCAHCTLFIQSANKIWKDTRLSNSLIYLLVVMWYTY